MWLGMNILELKIPPPIVALVVAIFMWLTPGLAGIVALPGLTRVLGAVVIACIGQSIGFAGILAFKRAKTTVSPTNATLASSLVVRGVYRWTRNPMYLGFLITLIAWAVFLANALAALWVPAFLFYITRFQIIPEERVLLSLFGGEYKAYKEKVHRWL